MRLSMPHSRSHSFRSCRRAETFYDRFTKEVPNEAIQLKQCGGSEQLSEADVPKPEAKPGQVVVRVFATSYNPIDSKMASGVMRQRFPLEFPFVPGTDFSGTIASLGEGVEEFRVGDEVYGIAVGTC